MRRQENNFARDLILRFSAPPPTQTVAEWCVDNLVFNEPEVRGNFNLEGRNYLIEPMNDAADPSVERIIPCFATGAGKTILFMGSLAWSIEHKQPRCLWVMPAAKEAAGSANFAKTRFIPMLAATKPLAKKWPADRHAIGGGKVHMGGAVIDFVGGNSMAQLKSNRCSIVIIDEADSLPHKLKNEAGSIAQALTRLDGVQGAKAFISSSPSVETGAVWEFLMKSNCKRRFIPCPRCNPSATDEKKFFVMIWSQQFCVLPAKFPDDKEIPVGQMRWSDKAKKKDGEWDIDKVVATAHMECPFCKGAITDSDMAWCDAHGKWIATKTTTEGEKHNGYHLPAMYAPRIDPKAGFGALAKKFLEAKNSSDGMRGFINSVLAEVDSSQEHGQNKITISDKPLAQPDWITLLTADFQKNWPFIWFVARRWCAFKLLPKFEMIDGKPDFVSLLDGEENAPAKKIMDALVSNFNPAWPAFAELMRFASFKENNSITEFLLAKKITGERLVKFFAKADSDTMKFRSAIYKEMKLPAPKGGDSELVAAGNLSGSEMIVWDEFRDVVKQFKPGVGLAIPNRAVAIDCGYGQKFNREVQRKCFESATEFNYYDPTVSQTVPVFFDNPRHAYCPINAKNSWYAIRGTPVHKPLGKGKVNHEIGLTVSDPYDGSLEAGSKVVEVLEIPSTTFWMRTEDLRRRRGGLIYSISPDVSWYPKIQLVDGTITNESNFKPEDYDRQMNEQFFNEKTGTVEPRHGRGGFQGRANPYHLNDAETYQTALAYQHQFFNSDSEQATNDQK